jgi:hypothetical protein
MKTKLKDTTSKPALKTDSELKNILAEDLKAFRNRSLMKAISLMFTPHRLTAA